jgi:phage shock protein A
MSFWERFRTTMRADAHGVIDALEDRALLLKQHLRDAELEVQHKRAQLVALEREHARLLKDRERIAKEQARYERDVELALSESQDELARHALQRLLPLQQLDTRIADRLALLDDERRTLGEVLAEQQAALSELQARVTAFLAEQAQRDAGQGAPFAPRPVEPETIELELLRRKRAQRDAQPSDAREPSDVR